MDHHYAYKADPAKINNYLDGLGLKFLRRISFNDLTMSLKVLPRMSLCSHMSATLDISILRFLMPTQHSLSKY